MTSIDIYASCKDNNLTMKVTLSWREQAICYGRNKTPTL